MGVYGFRCAIVLFEIVLLGMCIDDVNPAPIYIVRRMDSHHQCQIVQSSMIFLLITQASLSIIFGQNLKC